MVTKAHLDKIKRGCIIANMGHSNHEIDVEGLRGLKRERIRHNVTTYQWPSGRKIFLLAEVSVCVCLCVSLSMSLYYESY